MRLTTHEIAIYLLEPIKTQIFHVPVVNGGVLGEFSPAVYTPLWYIDRGPPHGETLNDPFACMLSIIEQDAGGGGGGGGCCPCTGAKSSHFTTNQHKHFVGALPQFLREM